MADIFLDFGRVQVLNSSETKQVFDELLHMRKLWWRRDNWHPKYECEGKDESIEEYLHYYTLGATLYMDARDTGWGTYTKMRKMYNKVFQRRLGWLYDKFLDVIQEQVGESVYETGLGLPGFHLYEMKSAPDTRKHHRCLHMDGQWWWGRGYFKEKYKEVDFRNQLSYTLSIKLPHNGSAIGLWGLPTKYHRKAREIQLEDYHPVIERYQTVQYVKEIKEQKIIEVPWRYELFEPDCGPMEKYIPHIIPHLEGHSFWYYGMLLHQMILGDSFINGDYRITFQGHALKCDGVWRLFW